MSRPRAPPKIWRMHDICSHNQLASIVKGRHTLPGVPPSFVFSQLGEKGFRFP